MESRLVHALPSLWEGDLMRQREPNCVICGELKINHHEFEAPPPPPLGCRCEIETWGNPKDIPSICSSYSRHKLELGICLNCDHDRACHRRSK